MMALAATQVSPEQLNTLSAVVVALAVLAAGVVVFKPLVAALARRLEARTGPDPGTGAVIEELRDRVAELEAREARLAELEERVDFAERLLGRGVPPARVAGSETRPAPR